MKKLLLILMFSLFTISAWAMSPVFLQLVGSGDSGCSGTRTFVGNPGDTETFEYQEDDFCCTEFSVTDNDTIISTYDNTQVKNGSYAASIAFTGSGTEADNYIRVDLGSGDNDYTNDFWFWPHDYNDTSAYTFATATSVDQINSSSRGYELVHNHYSTSGWRLTVGANGTDTSITLSTESWHRIEIDFNQNAASTVKIYNASNVLQDTLNFTANNYAPRYLFWGCVWNDADARATNYFDDIRFKSSGGGF